MGNASQVYSRYRKEIREITYRYPVTNVRVFGSVARGDDCDTSDLDLLVDPLPSTTLFDLGGLQDELQSLLKVKVDLVTPGDLPVNVREIIISEAKPV
ncbi:nucleotidyltransferase family protein [Marinobacter sp. BW6]|uniref:nucleotidyltransferase family protein n=1 Tax=Marinobacter sp. BW6 TaxID=2592624 RepID=UPI0011DEE63D|nr:nucleotidyltransferase family protein [Marinobacter sp. BW6]TYC59505.1 nucleotidyltransferase family protein [Marinobacter sp. BW6]